MNSETDFVAKNEIFQDFVRNVAKLALQHGTDVEALGAAQYPGGGTVQEKLTDNIAKIGENQSLRRAAVLEVSEGAVVSYVHNQVAPGLGKIGVLVALESAAPAETLNALGKQIAMHVAAAHPLALTADELDAELVERERSIAMEKAKESGKPQNIIEKMVEGGLAKFRKENALTSQLFVMDNKTPVAEVVASAAKEAGTGIELIGFVRFQLGEGIEKKVDDFAAEVAAAAGTTRPSRSLKQTTAAWQLATGRLRHKGVAALAASGGPDPRMTRPRFNRILLKLSGEALMGQGQFGIDPAAVDSLAGEIAEAKGQGHELCLVVGGGNIFRGMAAAAKGFDRATADYMGMLATVMNALALQNGAREDRRRHARPLGDPDGERVRALHPPPCAPSSGKGPDRAFRGGHRQSLFHDRYRRRASCCRDGLRCLVQGHQRRWRLHGRPETGRERQTL